MNGKNETDSGLLYEKYAEIVYKYLFSLCNDCSLAEELTQETFYQAIKSLHKYNGTCKVSTWLCEIAKRMWYKELRKNARRKCTELADKDYGINLPGLEEAVIYNEERRRLYEMVNSLEDTEREVILLHIAGEFSFREIGEMLGKTDNWARVTFYRAKQKLIKELS